MTSDSPLWVEKYRPSTIQECILPKNLKTMFQQFVDNRLVPNLLLCGRAGIGKTTVVRAMLEEIGADYIVINGSLEGRTIDTLRTLILNYVSSMSLSSSGRKYIIFDEADFLNPTSTQPALRNLMEEYSDNAGFILTCNYPSRILPELHSRCSPIEFRINKEEKPKIAEQFFKRITDILKAENVEYDGKVLQQIIIKFFPDWRRIINELQKYAALGKIDTGILANFQESTIKNLVGFMKEKNFTDVRKWVTEHSDISSTELFRNLYDQASQLMTPNTVPVLILIIAKYSYQDAFVQDKDINTAACLLEIMLECQFK